MVITYNTKENGMVHRDYPTLVKLGYCAICKPLNGGDSEIVWSYTAAVAHLWRRYRIRLPRLALQSNQAEIHIRAYRSIDPSNARGWAMSTIKATLPVLVTGFVPLA